MRGLYLAVVSAHVLAALVWLGGMFFVALVAAPELRRVEPPALRARIFAGVGERFRTLGWACIAILVVTGTLNLHYRGVLGWDTPGSPISGDRPTGARSRSSWPRSPR